MATRNKVLQIISSQVRAFSGQNVSLQKQSASSSTKQSQIPVNNIVGLSNNVLKVPNEPVGPGAAKNSSYKNPEYYCYHNTSYFEAEIEMAKHRLPQPSSKH